MAKDTHPLWQFEHKSDKILTLVAFYLLLAAILFSFGVCIFDPPPNFDDIGMPL